MYNDRPSITLPCNVMQQTPPPPSEKKPNKQKKKKTNKQTTLKTKQKQQIPTKHYTLKKYAKNISHFVVICYKICLLHL